MSVERGTEALLTRRRELLAQGAEPVGWKIGFNVPATQERLGIDAPLAGFLTTDSLVEEPWDDYPVIVESEVALEVGSDGRSIAALFPALEIADPPDLDLPVEQILAGNIFHRAVAFGPRVEAAEPGAARILVNGEEQHTVPADQTGERRVDSEALLGGGHVEADLPADRLRALRQDLAPPGEQGSRAALHAHGVITILRASRRSYTA